MYLSQKCFSISNETFYRHYLYFSSSFIGMRWSDLSCSKGSQSHGQDSLSQTSLPLDLVKAPQQIKVTLRRLEQVQGPGQNAATLLKLV